MFAAFPPAPLGPVFELQPAVYRFAGDDWSGDNAFTFTDYKIKPVVDDDGDLRSYGLARDITGYSARGLLYQAALLKRAPFGDPIQAPIPLAGAVTNATAGQFVLTLAAAGSTGLTVQDRHDAHARYLLRALIADPSGSETTVGVVPVFVL